MGEDATFVALLTFADENNVVAMVETPRLQHAPTSLSLSSSSSSSSSLLPAVTTKGSSSLVAEDVR